jgi:hypothetical protein
MAKKRKSRSREADILYRTFGDLEVVDATDDLRVIANDDDVSRATRRDPNNCVYAVACRRLFGASTALFLRSVAYVDLPDENGVRRINRFTIDHSSVIRKRVEHYDRTGVFQPGGFVLRAPRESLSLEGMRERGRRYREGAARKKRTNGKQTYIKGKAVVGNVDKDIRASGTGKIKFIKKAA